MLTERAARGSAFAIALALGLGSTVCADADAVASAAPPVDITILKTVNLPWQAPEVIVTASAPLQNLNISIVLDGRQGPSLDARDLEAGAMRSLTWSSQPGKHRCEVRVSGIRGGVNFRRVWSDTVDVAPPLELEFSPADVDVTARTLRFRSRAPIASTELSVYDIEGRLLFQGDAEVEKVADGEPIVVTWPELPAPLAKLELRAFATRADTWADLKWAPVQVEVPHDPIYFDDAITVSERANVKRLEAAYKTVLRVARDYRGVRGLKLYVLGLAPSQEQANHAADRALAVAKYFRDKRGVGLPILAGASVEPGAAEAAKGYVQAFVAVDEPVHDLWIQLDEAPAR